jgi:glycosyltransferase involved in cell wall biosynthesis
MIMPAYPWAAYKLMREHDVISIHTPMLETALIALLSKLTGKKLVITHHGDLILPPGFTNRFIRETMFWMYKIAARQASRIIAYSQDYADNSYYLKPFVQKVKPNYPPVHMPLPNPQRVEELRSEWSKDGGPVIGFAHRFVEEKRPDLALRALEVINQKYPNARIVFAGEHKIAYENTWERLQPLVNQYREQLIFLGLLEDQQELANFYAACDVLALTSDTECFALAQVESMLSGTPVVATNIPGGRVPVQMTGMGKLAKMGDWESIGEALVDVLNHLDQYRKPRALIEQVFSFKQTVDTYEQFFYTYAAQP